MGSAAAERYPLGVGDGPCAHVVFIMSFVAYRCLAVLTAVVAVSSCGIVDPGCDVCTTSVIVRGQISAETGPVADVRVDALSFHDACALSTQTGASAMPIRPTATGSYSLRVRSPLGPRDHCIELRIEAGDGTLWRDTVVSIEAVRFTSDYPSPSNATITRDVRLTPR
jgi:hypothetical protein